MKKDAVVSREALHTSCRSFQLLVEIRREREPGPHTGNNLPQRYQPVRVGVRKRSQKDRVDDACDRDHTPNPKRQGEDGR
jgi:hypothetical protein